MSDREGTTPEPESWYTGQPDRSENRLPAAGGDPWTPAAPYDAEPTRTLPTRGETAPEDTPSRRRRPGALSAAVLAGALVLGGAAGFGGAAGYAALQGDSSVSASPTGSATDGSVVAPTSTTPAPEGDIEKVAAEVLPSVVQIRVASAQGEASGSGVVLSGDGTILTNNHVVEGAEGGRLTVSFHDGTTAEATVLGTDPVTDIAVIRANGVSGLTPATIGQSEDLRVGQEVVAVGSPYGLDATVTTGIVSALDRAVSIQGEQSSQATTYPAIQTDAAINPGNSGGPLVDMNGAVVGINSSIRTDGAVGSTGGSIGLGFSIPVDPILPIVEQLQAGEEATHARLGVSVGDGADTAGAVIRTVEQGGSAAEAGLEVGDLVTRVDDQRVTDADALVAAIRSLRPDDEVTLTIERDGDEQQVTATLGSDAGQPTS